MSLLNTVTVQCPYCWQSIEIVVDGSVTHQEYVEDCQVCCRPIVVKVAVDECTEPTVEVYRDDE